MNTKDTIDFVSYRKRPEIRRRVIERRFDKLYKEDPELKEVHTRLLEAFFDDPEVDEYCEKNGI